MSNSIEEPIQTTREMNTTKPTKKNRSSTLKAIEVIENSKPNEDYDSLSQKPKRRKRRRPSTQDYLSLEMVVRKSFWDSLKEYLNHCSVAGARQMCDPELGWLERLIWSLVFCTALATIGYFLRYIWLDTLTKPLIVNMESTTYPISSIDFPAVAICNINRISKKALKKFALEEYQDLAHHNESLEQVESALLTWGRLINFSYNDSLRANNIFARMIDKYRLDNQRIAQIMRMLAPSCEEMLLKCAWEGAVVECSRLFTMHQIANRGHCCTFNYWSRMSKVPVKRQGEPGDLYGLNIILDPLLDDYAYPLTAILGFDVLILDPAHVADPSSGRVVQRICVPNMAIFMELKSTKQVATNEVRKYAISTRKCLFQDEGSGLFDLYSYSTCIVHCKIETLFSLCKCTPYFFAKAMQRGPVCTLENLRCLNKYKEKLSYLYPVGAVDTRGLELELRDSVSCPNCFPDCELTQYFTKSYEIPIVSPFRSKEHHSVFLGNIDPTNKSFLSIYHPLPDANLDKLDVVYYWYEIMSNIGGFCGIIIGFSFISAVELFYFLSIRLIANIYSNYKKYHS